METFDETLRPEGEKGNVLRVASADNSCDVHTKPLPRAAFENTAPRWASGRRHARDENYSPS